MKKEEQLTHLYTGSKINTLFIKDYLADNEISSYIRDDYNSGITAGFGSVFPQNGVRLFVQKKDYMRARILLEQYLNSEDKKTL